MARIPAAKPFGVTQDSWCNDGPKGKQTTKYRERHEAIFGKPKRRINGHVTIRYIGGKRIETFNPSTHGPVSAQTDFSRLPPAARTY
jgi:hypothetical protein